MKPLWMPEGSVRAILIIVLVGTVCYLSLIKSPIPKEMWVLVNLGIGFYFGNRSKGGEKNVESTKD